MHLWKNILRNMSSVNQDLVKNPIQIQSRVNKTDNPDISQTSLLLLSNRW